MPSSYGSVPTAPRWQEDGLSISFRSCQLADLSALSGALQQAGKQQEDGGGGIVEAYDVGHLDLGENELCTIRGLAPFSRLLSLDVSHNNIETLDVALPPTLLHLNASYNRLESAAGVGALTKLVELNLSYNLVTACLPLETLTQLEVLLLGGNRVSSLVGLLPLARLELLDLRFNYVEKLSEVRAGPPVHRVRRPASLTAPHRLPPVAYVARVAPSRLTTDACPRTRVTHVQLRLLALNSTLRTLTLQGNPVAKLANYRAAVGSTLPALLSLDSVKMPRSSTQRQAAAAMSQPPNGGPTVTSATRTAASKPLRSHTRYGSAETKATVAPALTLLPAQQTAAAAAQPTPSSRSGGALNASILRSSCATSYQFVPTSLTAGAWQPPSPRSAAPCTGGRGTSAAATGAAIAAAAIASSNAAPGGVGTPASARLVAPPPPALSSARAIGGAGGAGACASSGGSSPRRVLGGEQKRALAAAVASKEATLALRNSLSSARADLHQQLLLNKLAAAARAAEGGDESLTTPIHRAPKPYRGGGPPSAAAAAPTVQSSGALTRGFSFGAADSAVDPRQFLRRGSGLGGGAGGPGPGAAGAGADCGRSEQRVTRPPLSARQSTPGVGRKLDLTTCSASGASSSARGLVRSMSAEAIRPGKKVAAAAVAVASLTRSPSSETVLPVHLTSQISPPLRRSNTSREAAGAAEAAASAAVGLMEHAFEVGSGINVKKGVFLPAESPATLLETLLKMQAS
jgi:hypothetical protein